MPSVSKFNAALLAISFWLTSSVRAEEIGLFSSNGDAVAYIDTEDEATIYMWSGEPVGYVDGIDGDAFNIWGFNGKHLGWFEQGAIWDHKGNAVCATKEALSGVAKIEPFKKFKKFTPFKSFQEFVPLKPIYSGRFGTNPCSLQLMSGAK